MKSAGAFHEKHHFSKDHLQGIVTPYFIPYLPAEINFGHYFQAHLSFTDLMKGRKTATLYVMSLDILNASNK